MGTKLNPGTFDCYANALPDEPMFILLARDQAAPGLVRKWARKRLVEIVAGIRPDSDFAQIDEAYACAEAMEQWRRNRTGMIAVSEALRTDDEAAP
jgi:hypothetical protein